MGNSGSTNQGWSLFTSQTTYTGARLAELYMERIVCLHGVPKKIVSDSGTQFTSQFQQKVHRSLGTKLNFSSAYHPQTDGQTERINQILEDMLRACALQYGTSWDKGLPYAEFSYNNSYQKSLKMAPFEALYGRKCRMLCSGIRLVKLKCLDPMSLEMQKNK